MRQELLHGEKQEGTRQTEWNEAKRQQGETAECCKSCMLLHSRDELMHWLPVISEFWCHLTFQCPASNLNVLRISFRGCSNLSTAWHEDNQSRRLCSWWVHWVLPGFQLLQLKMEIAAHGKSTEIVCYQITIKALQPTPHLNWLTLDNPEEHWTPLWVGLQQSLHSSQGAKLTISSAN